MLFHFSKVTSLFVHHFPSLVNYHHWPQLWGPGIGGHPAQHGRRKRGGSHLHCHRGCHLQPGLHVWLKTPTSRGWRLHDRCAILGIFGRNSMRRGWLNPNRGFPAHADSQIYMRLCTCEVRNGESGCRQTLDCKWWCRTVCRCKRVLLLPMEPPATGMPKIRKNFWHQIDLLKVFTVAVWLILHCMVKKRPLLTLHYTCDADRSVRLIL